ASWLPMSMWHALERSPGIPREAPIVFSVDRAEDWRYATIVAAAKDGTNIHTEIVASLSNPSLGQLEDMCADLQARFNPVVFVMKSSTLKQLSDRLRQRGLPTEYVTETQLPNVCATTYSLIANRNVSHAQDPLLTQQTPRAV